mgnify:CR=1 FL=1
MRVTVNGDVRELRDGVSVEEFVRELGFAARRIAVALNLDVLPRAEYGTRRLREGDVVEIVQFIGGG